MGKRTDIGMGLCKGCKGICMYAHAAGKDNKHMQSNYSKKKHTGG